jgi:hypothetical protein
VKGVGPWKSRLFWGPVKLHRADRRVPFGAQKSRADQRLTRLKHREHDTVLIGCFFCIEKRSFNAQDHRDREGRTCTTAWAIGTNKVKKSTMRKIIFCTGLTRAAKAGQKSIVPYPHNSKNSIALEAQNGAIEGHRRLQWRPGSS